ncbi:MAG TPA: hypothetical protein VD766_12715 [Solirubrobacterales bacterium]|nr:hypothetical protein [Solirubrobacterales bacterium]
MREESTEPEDLPPLELTELRELDLAEATAEGRDAHMGAASGVVRRGDFVYVIADDELDLGVFRLASEEPGDVRPVLPGELPSDESERKGAKPDLEALTALPPFEDTPYGGLFGLGSGSDSEGGRDRGFFWAFAADGSLEGEPTVIDLSPLYGLLREKLGDLNVEGAAVLHDELWLFHRGNEGAAGNVVAEIALSDLAGSLTGDHDIDVEELKELRRYDLGEMDGVALCFSDATAISDDLVCFTASAEGEEDGDIRGSVVGTISVSGEVHRLRTIDRKWKVEGVHAAVDTGVVDFVFVCDQDDEAVASPLLTASMPLEPGLEQADSP